MRNYAFVFDLDGTLFDSEHQITRAINVVRDHHGFEPITNELAREQIGLPARLLLSDLTLNERDVEQYVVEFREELIFEISKDNPMFEGAAEFLNALNEMGHMIGVATSKPSPLAKYVIDNSEVSGMVHWVQGTDNFPAKPAPHVIQRCLKAMNCRGGFMFGDRTEDMLAARGAGTVGVGVAQSNSTKVDLEATGASLVYDNFVELGNHFFTDSPTLRVLS
jgi:phosphoglycolate phosphatase